MSRGHTAIAPQFAAYIQSVSLREPELLTRLRAETAAIPGGQMQLSPEQGQFLGLLVRLINARRTLEIGVFTGYSSLSVGMNLPPDGKIVACDISEEWTAVAQRYWREAGIEGRIDLRLGPALETVDALIAAGAAGTFDFVFIDADKRNLQRYYEGALVLLRPGGVVAVDNVLWHGNVLNGSGADEDTRAIQEFNIRLHGDERVRLSLVPLGDGISIAMKL